MVKEQVVERFIKLQVEQSPESENFLRELLRRGIISYKTARDYVIVKQYDEYLKSNKGNITHCLEDLADDFGLSERFVRIIHKRLTRYY